MKGAVDKLWAEMVRVYMGNWVSKIRVLHPEEFIITHLR